MSVNTGPARGMRDYLPEDVRRRQYVIGVIAGVFERYGFEPLETPAVENIETLLGKYGEEGDKLIFKILKRGEGAETGQADLALRYDLTVPLARVVAEYRAKLPKFFKRYQIQPVWRADRPQKGRFREFYQCDVDAIGSSSPVVEVEMCAAVSDVLFELGFMDFEIIINHRLVLSALLTGSGVRRERHADALVALDKFDKIGRDGVVAELEARGFDADVRNRLLGWMGAAFPTVWTEWLERNITVDESGRPGFENLMDIVRLAQATSAGPRMKIEPALARGLSYYTGAIFEVRVPDLAGSLAGGGRYDNLIGMFLGEDVPACGISLGLERILVVMAERNMFPPEVTNCPADVMVVQWFASRAELYLELASELRSAGVRVDVYPESPDQDGKKVFDRQIKYASQRGIPYVAIIGSDEFANGTVNVKNMKTGQQESVDRSSIATWLSSQLRAETS